MPVTDAEKIINLEDLRAFKNKIATDLEIVSEGSSEGRTLPERFADVVNVKDYGAKGDGTTDDTAAINAAMSAAVGKGVIFPTATYVSSQISIPAGVKLVDGRNSTLLRKGWGQYSLFFDSATDLTIENFIIKTVDNTIHGGALRGRGLSNVNIRNIRAISHTPYDSSSGQGDWAFTLSGEEIRLSDIYIDTEDVGEWGDGIHLGWVKNFVLENFYICSGDDAISLWQQAPFTGSFVNEYAENIIIGNGIISSPTHSGIKFGCGVPSGASDADVENFAYKNVLIHDVLFKESGNTSALNISDDRTGTHAKNENIIFDNCFFGDNNQIWRNVFINAPCGYVEFRGCRFLRKNEPNDYYFYAKFVDDLVVDSCAFTDTSVTPAGGESYQDFTFIDCSSVCIKDSSFRQISIGASLGFTNVGRVTLESNYFNQGAASFALFFARTPSNAVFLFKNNTFDGYIGFDEYRTVAEFISIGNKYCFDNALLYSITATNRFFDDAIYNNHLRVANNIIPANTGVGDLGSVFNWWHSLFIDTVYVTTNITPKEDAVVNLGTPALRIDDVYAVTGRFDSLLSPAATTSTAGLMSAADKTKLDSVGTVFTFKGSVADSTALPSSGNTAGDAYAVEDTGTVSVWDGTAWADLGQWDGMVPATDAQIDALFAA